VAQGGGFFSLHALASPTAVAPADEVDAGWCPLGTCDWELDVDGVSCWFCPTDNELLLANSKVLQIRQATIPKRPEYLIT